MTDQRAIPRMAVTTLDEMLAAGDPRLWVECAGVWSAWMSISERMGLFASLARSLPPDVVAELAVAVVGGAGHPLPSYLAPGEEAQLWVGIANAQEVRAYTLAGFLALRPDDRRAFLATARRIVDGDA